MSRFVFIRFLGAVSFRIGQHLIHGYECHFEPNDYDDTLFAFHNVSFPEQLANAVPKRRSEFLAGRICARSALSRLGFAVSSDGLRIGKDGVPVWPIGVQASISHERRYAICLATDAAGILGVGVDAQCFLSNDEVLGVQASIIDCSENELITSFFPDYAKGFTVVFSAKESIYKALYPTIRRYFDFSAVRLKRVGAEGLVFRIADDFGSTLPRGLEVQVCYTLSADRVNTYCLHA